ncbi:MAG: hypothetical protein ACI4RF_05725, partial [Eubacterium sp.]
MICFLTSSPCSKDKSELNPENDFVNELCSVLPESCNCLFICSNPDNYAFTDGFAESMKCCLNKSG